MKATKEHVEAALDARRKWRNDQGDRRSIDEVTVGGALSIIPDPAELQARVKELELASDPQTQERVAELGARAAKAEKTLYLARKEHEREMAAANARVKELEAKLAESQSCATEGDPRCANALRLRNQAMKEQDRADALEAKYAGIEETLALYSSPPGTKLVDVLDMALAKGLKAADERDELKAKLAAMPEPVVIDEAVAAKVSAHYQYKSWNNDAYATPENSAISVSDECTRHMLAALREVLGERVVVGPVDHAYTAMVARQNSEYRERAEKAEATLRDVESRCSMFLNPYQFTRLLEIVRPKNVNAPEIPDGSRAKAEPSDPSVANDKARELKAIENRCCSDSDYGHEGVHPVEVRIQTQQKRIVELQKKLEEAEAARKAAEARPLHVTCEEWMEAKYMDSKERLPYLANLNVVLSKRQASEANSPKNLDGSQPAPKLPDGWEYASPADKLRPNDRHALRQVEPVFTVEHARKLEAMWRAFEECATKSMVEWRGVPGKAIESVRADERVHNGG